MFESVLIANRGEIACRVIRTCKRLGVRSIAVFSEADRGALFTRLADVALEIGPAPAAESYLRIERILQAAKRGGAEAVHPGYGFLAENAEFARACAAASLRFIGPSPAAIEAMGLKHAAKALMERAGVPIVPGYHGPEQSEERLAAEAERIGFPLLVKAVAGGGGKGMRRVESAREFASALASARREAESAFGDGRVLLERYVARPRHIEVQILADSFGKTLALHERDCSTQRRHQKIVEEAPAPQVSAELRKAMGEAAVRAARSVQYEGAGTVELIADASQGLSLERFYFMEMNTRLQVEHPVTEMITGLDLVEWQLRIASGEPLPFEQETLPLSGHAIEVRVCAEDPAADYMPKTGQLLHLRWPESSPTLRVETGVAAGDQVSVFYDSMIAKLVAWGEDRATAIRRLTAALGELELAGVETNAAFLKAILERPAFRAGDVHTGFLEEQRAQLLREPFDEWKKLIALAVMGELSERSARAQVSLDGARDPWSPWAETSCFRVNEPRRDRLSLRLAERELEVELEFCDDLTLLRFSEQTLRVQQLQREGPRLSLVLDGERLSGSYLAQGARAFVMRGGRTLELSLGRAALAQREDAALLGAVRSPLPGRVLSVFVQPGAQVQRGDALLSLEAMKMEHTLRAGAAGVVAELNVQAGEQVAEGNVLLVLRAADAAAEARGSAREQNKE